MASLNRIKTIASAACEKLGARARYARAVIYGRQRWSGADIRGKARKWSAGYAIQRRRAYAALRAAGGSVIPTKNGLLKTAVIIGDDGYGNAVYETFSGYYVTGRKNFKRI